MAKANRKNQPTTNQDPIEEMVKYAIVEAQAPELPDHPDEAGIDDEGPVVIVDAAQVAIESGATAADLILKYGNKSNAIRALAAAGKTRSETAKLLGIRYQHVNNVLGQILKREIKKERDEAKVEVLAPIDERSPEEATTDTNA